MFSPMAQIVPEGVSGDASVVHFDITDGGGIHSIIRGMGTPNGRYAQLRVGGALVMSDTQHEKNTNALFVLRAKGDVLIAGLGLGMIVVPLLKKARVTSVTVVEKSPGVIDLVEPHLKRLDERGILKVVRGDIFTWEPPRGARFGTIYFDIWPEITHANVPEMRALHKRYRRRLAKGGFMDSWLSDELGL
jgi:spermidine synthase